ncbi:Gfo/Idh/MocA family oxidoreductase [Actinoallomurus acanthiterrae]
MDNLRVALIGYGTGGAVFHAPLIAAAPGLELAAVVTRDPERRTAVSDRYAGTELLDAPDDIWSGGYDLVVVTTPNRTHVPLARAALDAGLPVVVDKPIAATAAEARSLAGGPLVVPFHNRRWDGDFRTAARLIGDGTLGRVLRFESRFTRWRPQIKPGWKETADPAAGGGVLYDLGAHLIDQAVTLFGPPVDAHAELDVRRPGAEAVDDAFVALTHENGVRSHLWMSAISADLGPRFRVLGDRAAYVTYGLDVQEDQLRAGLTPAEPEYGVTPPEAYGTVGTPGDTRPEPTDPGRYQDFYPAVAAAVRGDGPPPVTLEDAAAGLDVIETAVRRAAGG